MHSTDIQEALESIKAIAGKNDKVVALKRYLQDEDFRDVVKWTLDPRLRFGIAKKTLDKIKATKAGSERRQDLSWETAPHDIWMILRDMEDGKITGGRAEAVLLQLYNALQTNCFALLERILLKKLDIGATESSVNKAMPGLIWTFDCMLAHPFEAHRVKSWPVAVEPKIDGVRCLVLVEGDKVGFFSRSGQAYTTFDHLIEPLLWLKQTSRTWSDQPGFILDGEVDSGSFNETVSQARKKDGEATDAVMRCFDILPLSVWNGDIIGGPYTGRRVALGDLIGRPSKHSSFEMLRTQIASSEDEVIALYNGFRAEGLEGAIVKPLDHLYERKRSHSWGKMKAKETSDVIITGFFEGDGKYVGAAGGVIADFDGVEVRIGGGWSDSDRDEIWSNQSDFLGRMIEVEFHEVTPDGSMRHPRFKRFRPDRDGTLDRHAA